MNTRHDTPPPISKPRRERGLTPRPRTRREPHVAGEDEDTVKEDRYETIAQALAWARRNGYVVR